MKKKLSLLFTIILSCMFCLCSCSKEKQALNTSFYFSNSVTCSYFVPSNNTSHPASGTKNLGSFFGSFNSNNYDTYSNISFDGTGARLYHIFIEKITFCVAFNENVESETEFHLKLTNVLSDSDERAYLNSSNPQELSEETLTFLDTRNLSNMKQNQFYQVTFTVNKVVHSVVGSTISIDISDSDAFTTNLTKADFNLKWQLFDFKIFGEARAY